MQINKNVFDPALLSFPDCDFLLAHAGEAPIVAVRNLPDGINRVTMLQWIERFYELEELKKATGTPWVGVEAVKDSIKVYLRERDRWKKDQVLGAPRNPSMFAFDARGNAHEGAPGSDSGRVRTYFDENGNRIPFAIKLVQTGTQGAWKPSWVRKGVQKGTTDTQPEIPKIIEPEGKNCIECGVPGCGFTATFRPESRSSHNAARARMSKHLRNAKTEVEAHLELHTLEFGQSSRPEVA